MNFKELEKYYKGKRVFVTGHTGFKGTWLSLMLKMLGADVYGYALYPEDEECIYEASSAARSINSVLSDIRDFDALKRAYMKASPHYVFHLAAQPIVRESYRMPRDTYETNVMGTVNLLECVRTFPGAISVLNITTDKVYKNSDKMNHAFKEDEELDGFDPYSNSKSCSELVTHSYIKSFKDLPPISTARAGNVIGGGDFAKDRIIPDCFRDSRAGKNIVIRNPYSTRPYQHVLEALYVYLMIAAKQGDDSSFADSYNVGPDECDAVKTGDLADLFVKHWGDDAKWENVSESNAPHEAEYLKLDCGKLKDRFSWQPVWHVDEAVAETVNWYKAYSEGQDMRSFTEEQIRKFLKG